MKRLPISLPIQEHKELGQEKNPKLQKSETKGQVV